MKTLSGFTLILAVLLAAIVPSPAQAGGPTFEIAINGVIYPTYEFTLNPGATLNLDVVIRNLDGVGHDFVTLLSPDTDASWISGFAGQKGSLDPNETKALQTTVSPDFLGIRRTQLIVIDPDYNQTMAVVFLSVNVFPKPEISSMEPLGAGPGEAYTIKGSFFKLPINASLNEYAVEYLNQNNQLIARQTCADEGVSCTFSEINTFIPNSFHWGDWYLIRVTGPNGTSHAYGYGLAVGPHITLSDTTVTGIYRMGDTSFHELQLSITSNGDRTAHLAISPIEMGIPICEGRGYTSGDHIAPGKTRMFSFGFYTSCDQPGTYQSIWSVTVTDDRGIVTDTQTFTTTAIVIPPPPDPMVIIDIETTAVTLSRGEKFPVIVTFTNTTGAILDVTYTQLPSWIHGAPDGGFLLPEKTVVQLELDSTDVALGTHTYVWKWTFTDNNNKLETASIVFVMDVTSYKSYLPIVGS